MMDSLIDKLFKTWQRRNIEGIYCEDKVAATKKLLELVPPAKSIGFSGSVTLNELGVIDKLEERGNKVFNPYKDKISREDSLIVRKEGAAAEYFLASANAVCSSGELIFFSAFGNRIAGISYAPNVLLVCGQNKIVANLKEGLKRSREYATPLNCKRLNWNSPCFESGKCREEICLFPEYKRMCCQVLIIEAEIISGRLKVVVVGEDLGY